MTIKRQSLILYYNEVDYVIPQHLSSIIDEKKQAVIKVFFDDGRVCVVLLTLQENQLVIDKTVMDAFADDTKLISINKCF